MIRTAMLLGLFASAVSAAPAHAQSVRPEVRTTVTPVAPPSMIVKKTPSGDLLVTPIPGVAVATTVKVQNFSDYDRNGDGSYTPMEFAQALYFLASSQPVAGRPALPPADRFTHRGAPEQMRPDRAVDLLNATADEFGLVDGNNDLRISPAELTAFALL